MLQLRLSLPCPLNRMYRAVPVFGVKRGVRFIKYSMQVLSQRARQRRDLLVAEVWKQCGGRPVPMRGRVQVSYTVTPRDKRTPDVDAYEKHLLDTLAHASVYVNDKQVVQVSKERMETPERPGRVDVTVWELNE